MIASKLTAKYFTELPKGVFLASNILKGNSTIPVFAEVTAPIHMRLEQWKRIVAADADQRLCRVFENEKEYELWLFDIMKQNMEMMSNQKGKSHANKGHKGNVIQFPRG